MAEFYAVVINDEDPGYASMKEFKLFDLLVEAAVYADANPDSGVYLVRAVNKTHLYQWAIRDHGTNNVILGIREKSVRKCLRPGQDLLRRKIYDMYGEWEVVETRTEETTR